MQRLLLDVDPGTDDAIAMLMALNSPDVELLGITVTGGNASLTHCTRNALSILEHVNRTDIEVARGAASPLVGNFGYAYDYHGHRGIGVRFPRASTSPVRKSISEFVADSISNAIDPISLVALGPLTNVASLIQNHPDIAKRISRFIVMGGALEAGNVTPHAEFNIFEDPEAAAVTFSSGLPITLVPLEACEQVRMDATDLRRYRNESAPAARLTHRILTKWFERRGFDQTYYPCDPLAAAIAINANIATYITGSLMVDTGNSPTRGQTTFVPGPGNVSLTNEVDANLFHTFMDQLLKQEQIQE